MEIFTDHFNKEEDYKHEIHTSEMNSQIMNSIKKAKQKLTKNTFNKQNQENKFEYSNIQRNSFQRVSPDKSNFIEKTIKSFKNKLSKLEDEKLKLHQEINRIKKGYETEITHLKAQLSRFVEKEFEASLKDSTNSKWNIQDYQQRLKLKEVQIEHCNQKLQKQISNSDKLKQRNGELQKAIIDLEKQKEKHIELNIMDKLEFEDQIKEFKCNLEKRNITIKKLQEQNINLKKQIHNIFNKSRIQKQNQQFQKKSKEEFEFELKQLTQKFNIKIKSQEKQINLLRKTIDNFKINNNQQAYAIKFNQLEKEIDHQKQRAIEKDKRIAIINVELQKLSNANQALMKQNKNKQEQVKKLTLSITKKLQNQKQLVNKLAKNGLSTKQIKQIHKTNHKQTESYSKEKSKINNNNNHKINQHSFQFQQTKDIRRSSTPLQRKSERSQSNVIHQIALQQRALANLRSNCKNSDSNTMSLNEIMLEIRRKTEKINDLKEKRNNENKLR